MNLAPYATEAHVDEALRLFQVSTLDAAMSGSLSGTFCLFYSSLTGNDEIEEDLQISGVFWATSQQPSPKPEPNPNYNSNPIL